MSELKEFVKTVEVNEFKNIDDFESISVNIDVVEETIARKDPKEGEEPTFNVFTADIEGVKVRVPKSVLNQLKTQLEEKDFESFKVVKKGSGLNTEYNVVTL